MGLIPDDLKYRKFTFAEKFVMVFFGCLILGLVWGAIKVVLWLTSST